MGKRMIWTSLWLNEEFGSLTDKAKLLYTGMITLADDEGRVKANPAYLNSLIFPYDKNHSNTQVAYDLSSLVECKLIGIYKIDDKQYAYHPNWNNYQFLRKDRMKRSSIPSPTLVSTKRQPSGNHVTPKCPPKISKDKIREGKIREEKIIGPTAKPPVDTPNSIKNTTTIKKKL